MVWGRKTLLSGCKPTADGGAWDSEEVRAALTIPTKKGEDNE